MQTETITTLETAVTALTAQRDANAVLLETARQTIERARFDVLQGKSKAARTLSDATATATVFVDESTRLNVEIACVQAQIAAEKRRAVEREKNDKLEQITREASAALTLLESEIEQVSRDLDCGLERILYAAKSLSALQKSFIDEVRPLVPEVDWPSFGSTSYALEQETRNSLLAIKSELTARNADSSALASAWCGTAPKSYLHAVFTPRKRPDVPHAQIILSLLLELRRGSNRAVVSAYHDAAPILTD